MKSKFGHIVFHSLPENQSFYHELFMFLGWKNLYQDENMLGVGLDDGSSFWFSTPIKEFVNDYDGPGVNHVGINTSTKAEVDETVKFLQKKGICALFETPRHRPEFSGGEDQTYYQVMFESPDRILFEIVYIGSKQ